MKLDCLDLLWLLGVYSALSAWLGLVFFMRTNNTVTKSMYGLAERIFIIKKEN